jgi:hypothetical protein
MGHKLGVREFPWNPQHFASSLPEKLGYSAVRGFCEPIGELFF